MALNVAAHGGLLGFLYSWAGVALGGTVMFLFWRRLIKRFFWKVASRSPKLEKAQQWVNRFDTSSLFMLSLLPFTPTSFMHFAFGMSDFDEKRYLRTVLLGKGLMVAMMAVFGQSLVSSLKNPVYLVLAVLLWGGMYWGSKKFCHCYLSLTFRCSRITNCTVQAVAAKVNIVVIKQIKISIGNCPFTTS